jgi:hypothetical protein
MPMVQSLKNRFGGYIDQLAGSLGDSTVSELHGRYFEAVARGNVYTGGMTAITSISNATFTTATTGATATPIVGVYNPVGNSKSAAVLVATMNAILTALQNTGPGGFVWMASAAAGPISTGNNPINAATLVSGGSSMKALAGAALTGMTGTLAAVRASMMGGGNAYNIASLSTAAGFTTLNAAGFELVDGALIVPPNAVLGLFATTTPVAHSAVSGIFWEEVPNSFVAAA